MTANNDLVDLIDARIKQNMSKQKTMGTMTARDTTGPGAMVVFDGAVVEIPCRVAGNVHAAAGDRVGLIQFGNDWVVMFTYARRALGHTKTAGVFSVGTKGNTTWEDMPGSPTVTVTKHYDSTMLGIEVHASAYATTSSAKINVGVRITNPAAAYDNDNSVYLFLYNDTLKHLAYSGTNWTPNGVPPAGQYTLVLRWRREDGTGTLNVDGSDWYSLEVTELEVV